jgi:hypothetical protein
VGTALSLAPPYAPTAKFGLTAGVDWATDDNAVAVVDHTGRQLQRFTVPSTAQGLSEGYEPAR